MIEQHNYELAIQHSPTQLANGLKHKDKIKSRVNGNRTTLLGPFLKKVEKITRQIGVTRTANISFLAENRYPVYQTCRPSIFFHNLTGQNTGAQGKGPTANQAKISALMETLEAYCAEPRNPHLIRGSFNFLKNQNLIANPERLTKKVNADPFDLDSPMMWTNAYCLDAGCEVLLPAELAYFPFFPYVYRTPSLFPCSTNGLASGASYLEAVIHALYEVIERHYCYLFENGQLHVEALHEEEISQAAVKNFNSNTDEQYEIQLYSLEIKGIKKNIPMIMSLLVGSDLVFEGYGCSANLNMSIDRGVSEAFQGMATEISGTREDMDDDEDGPTTLFAKTKQPERRTLRIKDYRKRIFDKTFSNLHEEYNFILKYLKEIGYQRIYAVNLTREGVGLPVVKIVCEGMCAPLKNSGGANFIGTELVELMFPNMKVLK